MSRRPGFLEVAKDIGTYVGGWMIIFKQAGIFFAPPSQVSEIWITLAVILIGVPGLSQLAIAKFGKGMPMEGSPQQPAQAESSRSPSGER